VNGHERFDFLVGRSVEQLWIWGTVRLVLDIGKGSPVAYIDFDNAVFQGASSESLVEVDVRRDRQSATPILSLLWQSIADAVVDKGVLFLSFADESELRALPSDEFESWTVQADGRMFQCMPGGEVNAW
jgi:hypothetical protein